MARVCNCISALATRFMYIHEKSISAALDASSTFRVPELLTAPVIDAVTTEVRQRLLEADAMALEA